MSIKLSKELQSCIKSWTNYLANNLLYSDHTLTAYVTDLFYFLEFLQRHTQEDISLQAFQDLSIQDFRAWLADRKRRSIKTTSNARALSVMRNFYKYLKQNEQIDNQNIFFIKIAKINKPLPRAISEECAMDGIHLIEKMAPKTWVGMRDKAILLLLYGCGLRISEALSLSRSSFIEGGVKVIVKGKGGKERMIPVLPQIIEAVSNYISSCPYSLDSELFFVGAGGKKLNPDVFRANIRKLKKSVGLPAHTSPHAFRHSFATHLLNESGDLRVIQELLGHKNLSTTQRYTKVDLKNLQSSYENFHPRYKK